MTIRNKPSKPERKPARLRDLLAHSGEGDAKMQASEARRAVAAAMLSAAALDLSVEDATVPAPEDELATLEIAPGEHTFPLAFRVLDLDV